MYKLYWITSWSEWFIRLSPALNSSRSLRESALSTKYWTVRWKNRERLLLRRGRRWINWKEPPPVTEVKGHCRQRQTERWYCFHCHLTRGWDFLCFLCGSAYWFSVPGKWIKKQTFDPASSRPKCNSMLVQDILAFRSTHTTMWHTAAFCYFLPHRSLDV